MNDNTNFLDYLSNNHKLPSFNLPTDAVDFIARSLNKNGEEQVEVKMSNGLEKALTQYGPGREIVVKKKKYISSGLYLNYSPGPDPEELRNLSVREQMSKKIDSQINRFEEWFKKVESDNNNEILSWHHRCDQESCMNTLSSEMPPSRVPAAQEDCVMCGTGKIVSLPLIRPPGFAPEVSAKSGTIIDSNSSEDDPARLSTRWPTAVEDIGEGDEIEFGEHLKIRLLRKRKLVNINPGRGDLSDSENKVGFEFCKKCGSLSHDELRKEHNRPYPIPYSYGKYCGINGISDDARDARREFNDKRQKKCEYEEDKGSIFDEGIPHDRIILGRKFTTDVLVFRIPWDTSKFVSMDPDYGVENISKIAATTVIRSLIESITGDDKLGLNIDTSDIDGDIRRYNTGEEEGWDLFIFERSDGGIGLLEALFDVLKRNHKQFSTIELYRFPVLGRALTRLKGDLCSTRIPDKEGNYVKVIKRPCKHICSGCLLDYSTQYMEKDLDRTAGYHFLLYSIFGNNFENEIGISMTDDQLNLLEIIRTIEGYENSKSIKTIESLGEVKSSDIKMELLGVESIINKGIEYKIHSPILDKNWDGKSFSRTVLQTNPMKIIDELTDEEEEDLLD